MAPVFFCLSFSKKEKTAPTAILKLVLSNDKIVQMGIFFLSCAVLLPSNGKKKCPDGQF